MKNRVVTTERLGRAHIPDQAYENPDGTAIIIDSDFPGNKRDDSNPMAGPFENLKPGVNTLKVW